MNKYKTFLFDFDGLLVDTEIVSYQIYVDILEKYQDTMSKQEYADYYSGHCETDNINLLTKTYHLPLSYEECFDLVIQDEKRLLDLGVALKKGARELLQYLKEHHYQIVLSTGSTKERCLKILNQHHLVSYFDEFVFAEDITVGKPNPDIFLKAAGKVNADPKDCLVFEDSSAGIEAAKNAGMDVICIPDIKVPDEEHLKKTVITLPSLDKVIEFLNK